MYHTYKDSNSDTTHTMHMYMHSLLHTYLAYNPCYGAFLCLDSHLLRGPRVYGSFSALQMSFPEPVRTNCPTAQASCENLQEVEGVIFNYGGHSSDMAGYLSWNHSDI